VISCCEDHFPLPSCCMNWQLLHGAPIKSRLMLLHPSISLFDICVCACCSSACRLKALKCERVCMTFLRLLESCRPDLVNVCPWVWVQRVCKYLRRNTRMMHTGLLQPLNYYIFAYLPVPFSIRACMLADLLGPAHVPCHSNCDWLKDSSLSQASCWGRWAFRGHHTVCAHVPANRLGFRLPFSSPM